MNEVSGILKFLMNPSSHALTLVVGMLVYHFLMVRPIITPLMKRLDKVFDLVIQTIENRG